MGSIDTISVNVSVVVVMTGGFGKSVGGVTVVLVIVFVVVLVASSRAMPN
jgi:hypothetical protein